MGKRNLVMLMVVAVLVTFFVGAAPASASSNYIISNVSYIKPGSGQPTGFLIIDLPTLTLDTSDQIILALPDGYTFSPMTTVTPDTVEGDANALNAGGVVLADPDTDAALSGTAPLRQVKLKVTNAANPGNPGRIILYGSSAWSAENTGVISINTPTDAAGEVNVTVDARAGSIFTSGSFIIARVAGSESVSLAVESVPTITTVPVGIIKIKEGFTGSLLQPPVGGTPIKALTLTLPAGFTWNPGTSIHELIWGSTAGITWGLDKDNRELQLWVSDVRTLANPPASYFSISSTIRVDPKTAKNGDIIVTLGGAAKFTPSTLVIGRYDDQKGNHGKKTTSSPIITGLSVGK